MGNKGWVIWVDDTWFMGISKGTTADVTNYLNV